MNKLEALKRNLKKIKEPKPSNTGVFTYKSGLKCWFPYSDKDDYIKKMAELAGKEMQMERDKREFLKNDIARLELMLNPFKLIKSLFSK